MAKPDVQKNFGSSVRAWRSRLGISQEALAERAGLHRTYVCDIERGARNVSLKSIQKLASALEVSLATLFAQVPDPALNKPEPARPQIEGLADVLFVEDEPNDIDLTVRALNSVNLANRIHVARDGAEALDYLFCTGEYADRQISDRPHVVLLDLNLPKVSGLEVLRRMKEDPRTRSIPVIVLTVSKFDRDIEASQRLGADGYIVKPVDFQSLSEATPRLSLQWALLKPGPVLSE